MDVRRGLALAVSKQFAADGVVVPSNIKRGVFTTGGVDNIDESGRIELHGTAISLTNHLTHDNMGVDPPPLTLDAPEGATIKLPDDFAIVPLYGQHEEKEIIELSKPEVLWAIDEFEGACFSASSNKESLEHPESSAAEQKKFLNHLKALCDLVKDDKVVNPFKEMGPDLITLDTGEVMDHEISNCLREAPNIGKAMFMEFVRDIIEKATKPFSDVIPRANLFTFTNRLPVDLKKGANKLGSAKGAEHESQPRYLCQRELNGRSSSKIVKIKTNSFSSSVRNFRRTQLIHSTSSSQQRLTLYSATSLLT
ncbi:hypothetical protein AAFF_G00353910 [Aldrovandia affinis]|uniref:Uncharacterized protein n=1 Tax=Aldrovandia affinis TaxID=143900 RepID=A0AAD7SIE5_9TELE|nr:hypothetical protein AAFF_G00353910 [Aldrovandia affinis]